MIPTGTRFRGLLAKDHEQLDAMLMAILKRVQLHERPEIVEQWAGFEDSLLSHLDAEEMFLLPGLSAHQERGATRVRADHQRIRAMLAEVGVGLEVDVIREEAMRDLATFLREHAEVEDTLLYRWADATIPASHFASLLRRLQSTWDRIVAPPASTQRGRGLHETDGAPHPDGDSLHRPDGPT